MITMSAFKPAWWLAGPHLQTLWPTLTRQRIPLELVRERLELPDGDFLDLDWCEAEEDSPLVLVLHGLEGSIDSPYAKGMLRALRQAGFASLFMHFRGCSGVLNRKAGAYHSGKTDDLAYVVSLLRDRFPHRPLFALGYSLGGNVLLKWLGETGPNNPLTGAAAVSVPFLLNRLADKMNQGFARVYQRHLVSRLNRKFHEKSQAIPALMELTQGKTYPTFWEFDDRVTAPLHGFTSAEEYYRKASCRQYLKGIAVPTLIIHAMDDPFMVPEVIPREDELSEQVTLELSQGGGHVGFIEGNIPGCAEYWLEKRIPRFFAAFPT